MKIYTKTGDQGETSLFDGTRVTKNHARVELYGEIDEINSHIGLALSFAKDPDFKTALFQIQRDLFALGAKLANPQDKKQKDKADFDESKITNLETQIDAWERQLEPMKNFILPGGTHASASLQIARCVCRRAERALVTFTQNHPTSPLYLEYINRLSDYLFVAARMANHLENEKDIPWS